MQNEIQAEGKKLVGDLKKEKEEKQKEMEELQAKRKKIEEEQKAKRQQAKDKKETEVEMSDDSEEEDTVTCTPVMGRKGKKMHKKLSVKRKKSKGGNPDTPVTGKKIKMEEIVSKEQSEVDNPIKSRELLHGDGDFGTPPSALSTSVHKKAKSAPPKPARTKKRGTLDATPGTVKGQTPKSGAKTVSVKSLMSSAKKTRMSKRKSV